ncbi:MAG: aminotransferase-like domain-containing protein [Candidatus Asgardarchaeia archaeon]
MVKKVRSYIFDRDFEFAPWTRKVRESVIRRLIDCKVKYYFGGGKPGVLPLGIISKIIIDIGTEQMLSIINGNDAEVIESYNYGPTQGIEGFRRVLAERMRRRDGINLDEENGYEDIVITTGSQQMIYMLLDTITVPGDVIITPKPAYLGFVSAAVKFGANVLCVETDKNGIIPEYVEGAIEGILEDATFKKRPKAIYVVSDSDNPKGTTLPYKRRKELYNIAEQYDLLLIEDGAYREIQFKGRRIDPIKKFDEDNDRVVYLRTTSKEAAPLRVGYSVVPENIKAELLKDKGYIDLCTSTFLQILLKRYYEKYIDEVLPSILVEYRKRCDAMCKSIDETFPPGERSDPTGGFFVWWESEKPFDSSKFLEDHAIPNDIVYIPGNEFYPIPGYQYPGERSKITPIKPKLNTMRLSFSYNNLKDIYEGTRKLGRILVENL